MANKIPPVMRYHGAKFRLAPWVMSFFPPHKVYVEPYGGAAGVLLQKPKSEREVYNDMDQEIVNVFKVLRCPKASRELSQKLQLTPYARTEFELSYTACGDRIEQARRTLIRAQMGFGSAGATKNTTGFRIDMNRDYGTSASLWAEYPQHISQFQHRLNGVLIENRPALQIIENHDRKDTLFFIDPPYVHSTRVMQKNSSGYKHEMTDNDHQTLINTLLDVKGLVVLSGYDNDLYKHQLTHWQCHKTFARASAYRGTTQRTECVWLNPACAALQNQPDLFKP